MHCPLTDENYHMIDEAAISKMKKGVYILNTSRGALIDSEALLDGIKSGRVGAACLDVYEEESDIFFDDRSGHILHDDTLARLLSMPNVLVTSHQAFLTEEALGNIAETTIANIRGFFAGRSRCRTRSATIAAVSVNARSRERNAAFNLSQTLRFKSNYV